MDNDDAIVQVLSDHEHVIDCIVWAPLEACRTIEGANYAMNFGGQDQSQDGNEELMNGDANEESKQEDATAASSTSAAAGSNAAGDAEDESRATANTRMTTKERIQQMKQALKSKREAQKEPKGQAANAA